MSNETLLTTGKSIVSGLRPLLPAYSECLVDEGIDPLQWKPSADQIKKEYIEFTQMHPEHEISLDDFSLGFLSYQDTIKHN